MAAPSVPESPPQHNAPLATDDSGFSPRHAAASANVVPMLRLLLPPNFAAAAPRNAIALKVELDLSAPPIPSLFPVLAVLQRLCGPQKPPAFLQLTRAQLRELITAATGQPIFAFVNTPQTTLLWLGPRLRVVSEHINETT